MLKAIKEYTCNLQKTYHKAKKKQNRDEDIYENKNPIYIFYFYFTLRNISFI